MANVSLGKRRIPIGIASVIPFGVLLGALLLGLNLAGCNSTTSSSGNTPLPTTPPPTTPPPSSGSADVLTYHNDNARTGQNLTETTLTTGNVNSSTFGKLLTITTNSKVDAEPLYLSGVSISGQTHNVLYVAAENDNVYAFDADNGTMLWQVSMLPSGETTSGDHGCSQITPEIGVTSTPVIEPSA